MNKVLLVFPYKLNEKKKDFQRIIGRFDSEGYDIVNFEGIDNDFDLMSLSNYINYVKEEINYKIDRISVLSNVREFIFVWYRAYNYLVDDFIYFIDESYEVDFLKEENLENQFYRKIRDFAGVDNETITGNIYLNINYQNYNKISNFLMGDNRFKYFNYIDNFEFNETILSKSDNLKKYKLNSYVLNTDDFIDANELSFEEIELMENNNSLKLNDNLIHLLSNNEYIIHFFLLNLFKKANINKIKQFSVSLFRQIKNNNSKDEINNIADKLFELIESNKLTFKEKISVLSLLVIIKPKDKNISEKIMELLKNDKNHMDSHYAILTNLSFYKNVDNLDLYDNFYPDRRIVRDNIKKYINEDINIKNKDNSNKKTIAIIAHQLLSILHSPTKMLIKYINYLKVEYPEYKIKIFVEDNFIHKKTELFFPYSYSSAWAKNLNEEHLKELNEDIDIYYSSPLYSRKQRTIDLVKEIDEFNPELVWAFGPLSIALDILYDYYPTMYISLNTDSYFIESADVHMYKDKTLVLEKNHKYHLLNEKNIYDRIVINIHEDLTPTKTINRKKYNIKKNDFVMISVGNRLDAELGNSFIDRIMDFIGKHKDCKWFIVGKAELNYLKNNYNQIFKQNIINISYEKDLSALYQICDVYINPKRTTGGASVYIALNNNVPLLTLTEISDAATILGLENTVGLTMDDYIEELERLYLDSDYKEKKINNINKILDKLNYKKGVEEFLTFFKLAKKNFIQRNN